MLRLLLPGLEKAGTGGAGGASLGPITGSQSFKSSRATCTSLSWGKRRPSNRTNRSWTAALIGVTGNVTRNNILYQLLPLLY